jgi:tetratricopeptide (TPR) repeat protein
MALPASAQEEEPQQERLGDLETRETAAMSEEVYKELARAQEAADAAKYVEATAILDRLMKRELTSYERIQALNLIAFVNYSQDRYAPAVEAFQRVLREEAITDSVRASTTFNLAQLYSATENWKKCVEMLDSWFGLPGVEPKSNHLVLRAQAHYQLGEYRQVVSFMQQAITRASAEGREISEQWYLLLRVAYHELGMHDQVARILERLIREHPQESYWLQLAAAYGEEGDETRQLNVMELAYLQGFLDTEPELMAYFGLLMNGNLPYRAANVLEKAMKDGRVESNVAHWRYLAQAWRLAQEDDEAIPALTRAAELSRDGRDDLVLAQSHMNLEEWDKAAAAARKAIAKGVERPDEAYILIGQAMYNREAFDEARSAFEKAQADPRSRSLATQWIGYIDREVDRRARLAAAIE